MTIIKCKQCPKYDKSKLHPCTWDNINVDGEQTACPDFYGYEEEV